jgi:hypothetical protein
MSGGALIIPPTFSDGDLDGAGTNGGLTFTPANIGSLTVN